MDEREPVDTVAPWTIKAVAKSTRDAVTLAARREGLTVGQWLERRVEEWEGQGSPVPVHHDSSQPPPPYLANLIEAARALAKDAGVPVPPIMAKEALRLTRKAVRQAGGAALPRLPKPLDAAPHDANGPGDEHNQPRPVGVEGNNKAIVDQTAGQQQPKPKGRQRQEKLHGNTPLGLRESKATL